MLLGGGSLPCPNSYPNYIFELQVGAKVYIRTGHTPLT
jgi:hypothetical protein